MEHATNKAKRLPKTITLTPMTLPNAIPTTIHEPKMALLTSAFCPFQWNFSFINVEH